MIWGRRPIRPSRRPGWYRFDLPPETRSLIVDLSAQVAGNLDEDLPLNRRLFPTAYPDHPELDAGYQILARGELIDQRRSAVDIVAATAGDDEIDEATLSAWMTVTNDLRLVLGTQLDVGEDDDLDDFIGGDETEDGPPWRLIYLFLGEVLQLMVEALSASLPEGSDDEID